MKEVEFDHEEEMMSCVYESFCREHMPKCNTFAFNDQCDDFVMHPFLQPFLLSHLHLMSDYHVCPIYISLIEAPS